MRITQVISNLLSNSWKFTIKGEVFLDVSYLTEQKLVYVSVKDTGIGIKNEDICKLMKPFSKLDNSSHLNDNGWINLGIGIGLNICKKIAKRLGGSLRIKSELDIGTEVIFNFKDFMPDMNVNKFNDVIDNSIRCNSESILMKEPSQLDNAKLKLDGNNSQAIHRETIFEDAKVLNKSK